PTKPSPTSSPASSRPRSRQPTGPPINTPSRWRRDRKALLPLMLPLRAGVCRETLLTNPKRRWRLADGAQVGRPPFLGIGLDQLHSRPPRHPTEGWLCSLRSTRGHRSLEGQDVSTTLW